MTLLVNSPATEYCAIAFDAIHDHVSYIPEDAFAVGGYVNGAYAWTDSDWLRFPNSYQIRINVTGDPTRGNALDIENGAATVADIVPWIKTRGPAVRGPLILYASRSNIKAVITERNKVPEIKGVYMWVATLDGTLMYDRAMTQFGQTTDKGLAVTDVSVIMDGSLRAMMAAA
jgi:hypothetical protein